MQIAGHGMQVSVSDAESLLSEDRPQIVSLCGRSIIVWKLLLKYTI